MNTDTRRRPQYLPPVVGYEDQSDDENALADAYADGLPTADISDIDPSAPAVGGGSTGLGPKDMADVDAAVEGKLASQPPPPPPGSQMPQGGPGRPPSMPPPMAPGFDDDAADQDAITAAGDRDRMNRMLRGFELASKQLTAGVLRQPMAEVVSQDSNYEATARAEASKSKDRRRADNIDKRNFAATAEQRRLAAAHQKFLEDKAAKDATEKVERYKTTDAEKAKSFEETKRHNRVNEGIQDRRNTAIAAAAAGGKTIPVEAAKDIGDIGTASDALGGLLQSFKKFKMSGYEGKAGRMASKAFDLQDTDSANYDAEKAPTQQAVGSILEGGKLAAGDEGKYNYMFPRGGDSEEVAERKVARLQAILQATKDGRITSFRAAGYKTPDGTILAPPKAAGPSGGVALVDAKTGEEFMAEPGLAKRLIDAKKARAK